VLGAHFGSIKGSLASLARRRHWPLPLTVSGNRKLAFAAACHASTASLFSGLYAVELLLDAGPTDRAQPEFAACFCFFRSRARSLGHSLKRGRTIAARAQMPAIRCKQRLAALAALASSTCVRRTPPAGHKEDRFLELGADHAALAAALNRNSAILLQAYETSRAFLGSNVPTSCPSPKHTLAELSPAPLPESAFHGLGKTGSLTKP